MCKVPELNCSLLSQATHQDIVLGEGTNRVTGLMCYNGSSCCVTVKESKWNDLYEVEMEAGVIEQLQCQHHANLPFPLAICTREKSYLLVTQFYGGGNKSLKLSL